MSGSTGPIFTIFFLSGRYLIRGDRSDLLLSDSLKVVAMATNFGAKSPKHFHFLRSGIAKRIGISQSG